MWIGGWVEDGDSELIVRKRVRLKYKNDGAMDLMPDARVGNIRSAVIGYRDHPVEYIYMLIYSCIGEQFTI